MSETKPTLIEALNSTTVTFYIITLLFFFFFGNILVLFLLFFRIFLEKKYLIFFNNLLGEGEDETEIRFKDFFSLEEEEDKRRYFVLGILNISLVSFFIVFITSLGLFFNINFSSGFFSYLYIIYFILLYIFHPSIFRFFFLLKDTFKFISFGKKNKEKKIESI